MTLHRHSTDLLCRDRPTVTLLHRDHPQGSFRHFIGARADAVKTADVGATEGGT